MTKDIHVSVQPADLRRFEADVVALKFAHGLSGGAWSVAKALGLTDAELRSRLPTVGSMHLVAGRGLIKAHHAFFLSVVAAPFFNRPAVHRFGFDVLKGLRRLAPDTRHLAMTVHGTGSGLGVAKALRAELEGCTQAVNDGEYPPLLERISIVDRDGHMAQQVAGALSELLPRRAITVDPSTVSADETGAASPQKGEEYDVFVSYKSADEAYAREISELLKARGLRVFFSRESLPMLGSDEYHQQIDRAIENSRHMVVVASSGKHALAKWVQYEWRLFLGERLAGRKTGNLVTVIAGEAAIADLPISLRNREVVGLASGEQERLCEYLRSDA